MSPSRTIYVVIGECGEYSDREEWLVEAYHSEDAARARVVELESLVRLLRGLRTIREREDAMRRHQRGDQNFQTDYTSTRYRYQSVRLEEGSR